MIVRKARRRTASAAVMRRIAASAEGRMRGVILDAIRRTARATRMEDMVRATEIGDYTRAIEAIPWDEVAVPQLRAQLQRELAVAIDAAGDRAIEAVTDGKGGFTVTDNRPVEWMRRHGANLVTEMSMRGKEALRRSLTESLRQGLSAQDTARVVRSQIGLRERDVDAVSNRLSRLREKGHGDSALRAEAQRYSATLLQARALAIARTEAATATTAGQQMAWEQAAEDGWMDKDEVVQVWRTSDPCPICEELDGEEAALGEAFPGGYMGPAAHPNCRCSLELKWN